MVKKQGMVSEMKLPGKREVVRILCKQLEVGSWIVVREKKLTELAAEEMGRGRLPSGG